LGRLKLLIGFLLFCPFVFAQTTVSKKMEGIVKSKDGDVAAVHVLNTSSSKATITNINGYFSIPVKLNDTLVFSAVQYKKKTMVISEKMLSSSLLTVYLLEALNQLDEVVVMPYNLTGNLGTDLGNMDVKAVSASSLGLPNANVKVLRQSERLLSHAEAGGPMFAPTTINVHKILNRISGRTKRLKKRVARDQKYERTQTVRESYEDSIFKTRLKIPLEKIDDFMYFCEVDETFDALLASKDELRLWDFLILKSKAYRKNNNLD